MDATTLDVADRFPILREMDFLNHAGVAPLSGPAAEALRRFAAEAETAAYTGGQWYRRIEHTRALAATIIGAASPEEIAFVPNTSTGLSMVANGLDWNEGDEVIISNVEYPANRYPWIDLQARRGVRVVEVAQQADGRIAVEEVLGAVTGATRLVALSHVQYSSGHRIALRPIAEVLHALPRPAHLCVDAIQSVGVLPVDVQAMGIDFLAADGHKWMLGPEGAGILYVRRELCERLHPNVVGWLNMVEAHDYGSYRYEFKPGAGRFEPGSYNVPGLHALGASLELLLEVGIDEVWRRVLVLTDRLCRGLTRQGWRVFSPREQEDERSGIVVLEPPVDWKESPAQIVTRLQKAGIVTVVRNGRLRASPHFYNTAEQMDRLVAALVEG